jgi:hypothetical protein
LKKASAFYPRSPIAPRRNDPVHRPGVFTRVGLGAAC